MSEPIKQLVMFSSGISSWAAAKRRVEQLGTAEGMVLLFADTLIEDPDNYRFLGESAANIFGWDSVPPVEEMREAAREIGEVSIEESGYDGRLVIVADGRDPWEVMRDERIIGNSRIDPCSKILKRQLLDKWRDEHASIEHTEIILGICWDESHRIDRVRERTAPWNYTAPLCDKPWMSKDETLAWSVQEGVQPPSMYDLGFPHANCGGFCIKAGQKTFKMLLEHFPERYAYHEEQERQMREIVGDHAIMKCRRGGKAKPLTMEAFRKRIEADRDDHDQDLGGCTCALPL